MADQIKTESTPPKRRGRPPGSSSKAKNPKSFSARMAEYEKDMPKLTLNDRALLQAMINMELQFEVFQRDIAKCEIARDKAKLQDAYNAMLKEYRQIQDSLGMGRNQRSTDIDMQREVDKLVAEATEVVDQIGAEIKCQHCLSDFEMGTIIFHFRDDTPWSFVFTCPQCRQISTLSGRMAQLAPPVIEGKLSQIKQLPQPA